MAVVSDLGGSGGAERHFSQLHEHLRAGTDVTPVFITAQSALGQLQRAGRLIDPASVVALSLGARPGRGWIGVLRLTLALLWATWRGRFDVVHLCLPTPVYVPYAAIVTRLPRSWRPRVVLNVIDCTLAPNLVTGRATDRYEAQVVDAHKMFFAWAKLDGVYSWYDAFVRVAKSQQLFPPRVVLQSARYCFTDVTRFRPADRKDDVMVYAGRLSMQKRPLLFVDAVASLHRRYLALVKNWRFEMYGSGVLAPAVEQRIADNGLQEILELRSTHDMAPVFGRARLFVSTQAIENFTSLAMLEAMAAGNAVIAEDTGQTSEFVRNGENGFLVASAEPDAFADAIAKYLTLAGDRERMAAASRVIATEVHTIENFARDITVFWHDVAAA